MNCPEFILYIIKKIKIKKHAKLRRSKKKTPKFPHTMSNKL